MRRTFLIFLASTGVAYAAAFQGAWYGDVLTDENGATLYDENGSALTP